MRAFWPKTIWVLCLFHHIRTALQNRFSMPNGYLILHGIFGRRFLGSITQNARRTFPPFNMPPSNSAEALNISGSIWLSLPSAVNWTFASMRTAKATQPKCIKFWSGFLPTTPSSYDSPISWVRSTASSRPLLNGTCRNLSASTERFRSIFTFGVFQAKPPTARNGFLRRSPQSRLAQITFGITSRPHTLDNSMSLQCHPQLETLGKASALDNWTRIPSVPGFISHNPSYVSA